MARHTVSPVSFSALLTIVALAGCGGHPEDTSTGGASTSSSSGAGTGGAIRIGASSSSSSAGTGGATQTSSSSSSSSASTGGATQTNHFASVLTQGTKDANGVEYQFTEARALVLTDAGDMLLSTGRWMDTVPGHGQILRYLGTPGQWEVEYTAAYETIASMATIRFPDIGVDQTVAGVWGTDKTPVLIRDNATKKWEEVDVPVPDQAGGAQVRSFAQHHDAVTGQRLILLGQDPIGVLSGVYATDGSANITWNTTPELPSVGGYRIMAFAELDGVLYCVMDESVYARNDGLGTWTKVGTNPSPGTTSPGLGALRGLIASPYDDGTLWMWNNSSAGAGTNALLSLDPAHDVWKTLFSFASGGGIQAYNEINHMNGEVMIGGQRGGADYITGTPSTGYVKNTVPQLGDKPLVAVRTIGRDSAGNIYMGGYDCDGKPAHQTGWVYEYTP
jgi:hypothetical protein